jgi:riboflavin kinase/FMN adenylyltransferase
MKEFKFEKKPNYKINNEAAVAIGSFDGVHLGHLEVFKEVFKEPKLVKGVITFSNLGNMKNSTFLNSKEEKKEVLTKLGFDFIIDVDLTKVKNMEADDFLNILKEQANIKMVSVGYDFKFGKLRKGTHKNLSAAFDKVTRVPLVKNNNAVISSSKIIKLIEEGAIQKVNELLGRNFGYEGRVMRGEKMGSKFSTPTANMDVREDIVHIKHGVYASYAIVGDQKYPSVTSVGSKPTLNKDVKKI